jgi:hypothetical protein
MELITVSDYEYSSEEQKKQIFNTIQDLNPNGVERGVFIPRNPFALDMDSLRIPATKNFKCPLCGQERPKSWVILIGSTGEVFQGLDRECLECELLDRFHTESLMTGQQDLEEKNVITRIIKQFTGKSDLLTKAAR